MKGGNDRAGQLVVFIVFVIRALIPGYSRSNLTLHPIAQAGKPEIPHAAHGFGTYGERFFDWRGVDTS